eukprot:TRINITY_DN15798_c0_g1_i2.p1 TRINITY_DN15798_c0_g1~~TRINITY_DN15798_c0_g1_i2.p1  ORF type:complete len:271 (+),score=31.59 TRINITY_DN15798_c0_g1_i2:824-1636(+)
MLSHELAKLKQEQLRRLAEQVQETTGLLQSLWDEYFALTGDRSCCVSINREVSEVNLTCIEGLVVEMEDKLKAVAEVRKWIVRRNEIVRDEAEMLASQADPKRLLDKKGNMANLLLREEKIRNAVKKELPKIDERLRTFALDWEERTGSPFLYGGKALLDVLDGSNAALLPADWDTQGAPGPESSPRGGRLHQTQSRNRSNTPGTHHGGQGHGASSHLARRSSGDAASAGRRAQGTAVGRFDQAPQQAWATADRARTLDAARRPATRLSS